jgi:thymidylate synthase (FAD)
LKGHVEFVIIPNACCTEIVMTMNFREFRHFIKLRADKYAQWEIRDLAKEILDILFINAPNIFKDLKEEFNEQK